MIIVCVQIREVNIINKIKHYFIAAILPNRFETTINGLKNKLFLRILSLFCVFTAKDYSIFPEN